MIAAIGLLLVLGSVGVLLYQGSQEGKAPPDVQVRVDAITPVSNGYLVAFTAINKGGFTLASVEITAALKRGEEKTESSQTTIDYISKDAEVKGGFFFSNNPKVYILDIRATGYQKP